MSADRPKREIKVKKWDDELPTPRPARRVSAARDGKSSPTPNRIYTGNGGKRQASLPIAGASKVASSSTPRKPSAESAMSRGLNGRANHRTSKRARNTEAASQQDETHSDAQTHLPRKNRRLSKPVPVRASPKSTIAIPEPAIASKKRRQSETALLDKSLAARATLKKRGRPSEIPESQRVVLGSHVIDPQLLCDTGVNDLKTELADKKIKASIRAASRRVRGTGIREYTGAIRHVRSVAKVMAGAQPSLPARATALSDVTTAADKARLALHISSTPDTLPCREEEYGMVYGCIAGAIEEGMGSCIYISGIPGTGKTATVQEVVKVLRQLAHEEEIAPFTYVEINGMKITDPTHSYVLLWEALSPNKELITAKNAMGLLQKYFQGPASEQKLCVVVMDELDQMATKKQDVMYNFFNWPSMPNSRLIVVAIANTMDLPERTLSNKITSRLGHQRIAFQPYDANQLVQIVSARLEGLDIFQAAAIELAARRVSAITGDARRALDICRRAIDLAEARIGIKSETPTVVEPADIIAATREMTQSATSLFIKTAAFQEKIFLCCALQVVIRKGLAEVSFNDIAAYHRSICRQQGWTVPSVETISEVCWNLSLSRALLCESSRLSISRKVKLLIEESDLRAALLDDTRLKVILR